MTFGIRETWAHTWAEPLASCVTRGMLQHPSAPQILCLHNQGVAAACCTGFSVR